ncbi:Cell surface protein [Methanosarcina siciliae HI350]|uniref:Cell surface protein n=1 Tax=Methanosarcina siciliae HI350 TaxID=1434119 RepID=A0A0E3PF04_9EURY|nr:Cell surface protein [Methanosarcina siciliae HI350]
MYNSKFLLLVEGGIRINILRILLLTTLILTLSSFVGAADVIHANSTLSIQDAVDSADPGDEILVAPGTYTENIFINKDNLVIKSSGDSGDTTIVADDSSTYVINIQGDNVTIQGLSVSGGLHGIVLENSKDSTLKNNVVYSNLFFGIYLSNSNNITLENNTIYNNTNGINLVFSSGNQISGNKVFNDTLGSSTHNIFLNNSHNNKLQRNTVSNGDYGIAMRYSNNNNLTSNNAYANNRGIYLTLTSGKNTLLDNQVNSNLMSGIILDNAGSGNNLINNTVRLNTATGIWLANSSNNNLNINNASENSKGIYLQSSASENTLSGNIVNSNTGSGIVLENAGSNNNLTGNIVDSNVNYGIYLVRSSNNYLLSNNASRNSKGIYIVDSSGNKVSSNILSDTITEGIMLSISNGNTLSRNRAFNNSFGIYLNSSDSNNISSNTVTSSRRFSIGLCAASNGNQIFDNHFNSTYNTRVRNASNDWNKTKTKGTSIAGGPYIGGNFWEKPDGTGHSQIYNDTDGDGITDEDGIIKVFTTENVMDYLPLVAVAPPVVPAANFSTNVSSGYAPLTVQFTDLSEDATSRNWDFGDGNNSSEQNPIHSYPIVGSYTVNLTVYNPDGTDSKTAVITVLEEGGNEGNETEILPTANFTVNKTGGYYPLTVLFTDTSQNATGRSWDVDGDGVEDSNEASFAYTYTSRGTYEAKLTAINANGTNIKTTTITVEKKSSGGSSSGGGGGGSPESAQNVEVKELSQVFITNDKTIKFNFVKNATCVVYVEFDAKKTAGKTTTIVEQLKNTSTLVSGVPSDEIYKFFNIWVGNSGYATEKNIENPVIGFKVEKAWVQDEKIDQSSITLNRYSNKTWEQLPASLSGEDNKYLYFTAETPGFSSFAITGKASASQEKTATEIQSEDEPDNSEENTGDTGSEAEQETEPEKNMGMPGFEMIYGVAGLLAVFLYKKK